MGILEGLLYTMWRGLAIGIIISAPMGPVGILCVQRTLDKGRKTGLYTGIGAAISDLLYCLMTGFGLSFIEEFLERNSNIIQLLGSVVLIGFGIYLFKSNPSRKLKKPTDQKIPAGRNILNGFLFTFSNPLIIFLIIGLFARFNFLLPEIKFYHYIVGFICIFVGALLWWYLVTFFVDKVRAHFNLRSMWLINKIIGGIIFLFAIVGIITAATGMASARTPVRYMNSTRGFNEFRNATDSALIISGKGKEAVSDLIPVEYGESMQWQFRIANLDIGQGWGIVLKGKDKTVVRFKNVDEKYDETYASPHVEMCVKVGDNVHMKKDIFSDFDLYKGFNAFKINVNANGWNLKGGNRVYEQLASFQTNGFRVDSIGFIVYPGSRVTIDHMVIKTGNIIDRVVSRFQSDAKFQSDPENNHESFEGKDPMEGEWAVFDRSLDDEMIRMGGDYRVRLKKNSDGYDVIYLTGAAINPKSWNQGMIKGRLISRPFKDVFDVEWLDADGNPIEDAKAQYEDPVLRIIFPEQSSELRLRKTEDTNY